MSSRKGKRGAGKKAPKSETKRIAKDAEGKGEEKYEQEESVVPAPELPTPSSGIVSSSGDSGLGVSLKEELECILCLDFAASPIHNCANGHITCGVCLDKLKEFKCSMCEAGLSVSAFGERMAKKLEVKLACLNGAEGCKEVVLSTEFKRHLEADCEFRPISCQEGNCDGRKIRFSEYFDHFEKLHPGPNVELVLASTVFIDPIQGYLAEYKSMFRWNGKVFLEKEYRNPTTVYMTAQLLGSREEAEKLKYQLVVKSLGPTIKNVSTTYEGPIFPFHSKDEARKQSAYFASYPRSLSESENQTAVITRKFVSCD